MATQVYHKGGRGGAGNFYIKPIDKGKAPVITDLEAQTPPTTVEQSISDRPSPPNYVYSGRGGAGNWFSPKEVQETAKVTPALPNPRRQSTVPVKPAFSGRGGMGNYSTEETERQARELKLAEEEAAKQREQEVVEEVEMTLLPPQRAYLPVQEYDE